MDYYEILNIEKNASFAEIKKSYQQLILKYHPDKNPESNDTELFHQIDLAYKVLKDPESRRAYDSQQFQNKSNIIIHDTVRSSDFKIDEENDIKYQTCKCGGLFILDEECLEEEYLIECNECSLVICVLQISTSNNNKSEIT